MSAVHEDEENGDANVLEYVFGLTFLKPEKIDDGFEALMGWKPVNASMDKFFDYLLDRTFARILENDSLFAQI